jgi:hypothetical protein
MKSILQRLVAYHEALQNIHPLEDGSGQARLFCTFVGCISPLESPLSEVAVRQLFLSLSTCFQCLAQRVI